MTKFTTGSVALIAGAAMVMSGCEGVHYANLATLGVTCCLFFGTLNLGRRGPGVRPPSNSDRPVATSAPRAK